VRWFLPLLLVFASACAGAGDTQVWFENGRLTAAGVQLLDELARADQRGLQVSDYDAAGLQLRVRHAMGAGDAALERVDAELRVAAARIAVDLARSLYTLNWETLAGPGERTEPSVSLWLPPPPAPTLRGKR